jgi:hypothetical protein
MIFVKGNDGRATIRARDQQYAHALKTAGAGLLVLGLIFAFVGMDSANFNDMAQRKGRLGKREKINWTPEVVVSTKDLKRIAPILDGTVHLINIHVDKLVTTRSSPDYYDGIEAEFCAVDWKAYKEHPWKVPMYRDILNESLNCRSGRIVVNLKTLMEEVYLHDQRASTKARIKSLKPNFIFHESRCGSTLLANAIGYSNPKENRVYSEAGPPLTALKICGENYEHCSKDVASSVFRDVIYLMGRVPSDNESVLFFKMQSMATASLDIIVQKTFPDAPWVFIYRDPEEVLVSHLDIPHKERAKCIQSRRHPPYRVVDFLEKSQLAMKTLSEEEYCAIYLSSICHSALDAIKLDESNGKVLNYENILDKFMDDILPNHFGVALGSEEIRRMELAGTKYSKSRDEDASIWSGDSSLKHDSATDAIHKASNDYLAFSYIELEGIKS